ncbi:MAG: hypothetical protein AAB821_03230 [Patescibacteria group bacterium]
MSTRKEAWSMSHNHHPKSGRKHRRHFGRSFAGWAGDKFSFILYYLPLFGRKQAEYITGEQLAKRLEAEDNGKKL